MGVLQMTTQLKEQLTVKGWLDVYGDLDAFLAKGGQLLDLQ